MKTIPYINRIFLRTKGQYKLLNYGYSSDRFFADRLNLNLKKERQFITRAKQLPMDKIKKIVKS